ncbi:DUF86 domain-containing protein [Wenzhouxiangella sp. AB-CW3]|uniref:type VII toxin-antitoxin system HepT family RNase toxin n=1 Tax=Wenzhouxiangella sp. AB-CW3 TaxID=2771012 RepID=UPI00168B98D8|nr:DUF86 domain-containing protein [Wenzhouxiangella sp. AB-CW3]QOC22407.1 DUF86 domain-containing protein [Wenzhouxiangella sp. AB-CW3]
MASAVIHEKLESLRRCLGRIRQRRPETVQALKEDVDVQDILSVNLTRAVQLCVDIASHLLVTTDEAPPETMGQSFDRLANAGVISRPVADRMKAAVGFRNIAIHSYQEIDWEIVFAIVTRHLDDFEDFARAVVYRETGRSNPLT